MLTLHLNSPALNADPNSRASAPRHEGSRNAKSFEGVFGEFDEDNQSTQISRELADEEASDPTVSQAEESLALLTEDAPDQIAHPAPSSPDQTDGVPNAADGGLPPGPELAAPPGPEEGMIGRASAADQPEQAGRPDRPDTSRSVSGIAQVAGPVSAADDSPPKLPNTPNISSELLVRRTLAQDPGSQGPGARLVPESPNHDRQRGHEAREHFSGVGRSGAARSGGDMPRGALPTGAIPYADVAAMGRMTALQGSGATAELPAVTADSMFDGTQATDLFADAEAGFSVPRDRGGLSVPVSRTMPEAGPAWTNPTARADLARSVASQLSMAASVRSGAGTVDIALHPEELGRIAMTLSTRDDTLVLAISSERPETQDLMRRHIAELSAEFREMGYDSIAFDFDAGPERHDGSPHEGQAAEGDVQEADVETSPDTPVRVVAQGLDIRV